MYTTYTNSYAIYGARFWESDDKRLNFYIEGCHRLNKNHVATCK